MLRIGVVGMGFGRLLADVLVREIPQAELVAVARRDAGQAAQDARRLGVPLGCGGMDCLMKADLDALVVALPPAESAGPILQALGRGMAVFAEKPLTEGRDQALEVLQAWHRCGRPTFGVDFLFAELETWRKAREILREGVIGQVLHMHVTWLTESLAARRGLRSWKTSGEAAGGVMASLGSHVLFLLEWLAGPIGELSARRVLLARAGGSAVRPHLVRIETRHLGGAEATAVVSNTMPGPNVHRWEVSCAEGRLVLENTGRDYVSGFVLRVWRGDRLAVEARERVSGDPDGRRAALRRMLGRFVESAGRGLGMEPGLEQGVREVALREHVAASITAAGAWRAVDAGPGVSEAGGMGA